MLNRALRRLSIDELGVALATDGLQLSILTLQTNRHDVVVGVQVLYRRVLGHIHGPHDVLVAFPPLAVNAPLPIDSPADSIA